MNSNIILSDSYKGARACLLFFLLAVFISFLYIVITGTYNGDFYGVPQTLGLVGQILIFALALMPYGLVWVIYRFFKSKPYIGNIPVPTRRLTIIYYIFIIWFIAITIKYDVGIAEKGIYEAPAIITPFIQILNRVNPFYLGVLFILLHRGSRFVLFMGIFLLIFLSLLRAGLGVFIYILFALLVRYLGNIIRYVNRHRILISISIIILPAIIGQLYSVRDSLRDKEALETAMPVIDIIAAKLMGRISSISDTAIIFQESNIFKSEVEKLDVFYYQEQAFGGIFGVQFIPRVTPERLLINIYGGDYTDTSFMTGLPGNLYMAWLISPILVLFNLLTLILICFLCFYFSRLLRMPLSNEFAFILLLYPLTSGVSNEASSVLISLISFCILFKILSIPFAAKKIYI